MKTLIKIGIMTVAVLFFLPACKKEAGLGGKKEIHGMVTYTGGTAVGAVVYITYDASDGTGEYSNSTTAGSDGHYEFTNLQKGDYFIDAEYTDAQGFNFNTPGVTVTIGKKKGEVEVDLALE